MEWFSCGLFCLLLIQQAQWQVFSLGVPDLTQVLKSSIGQTPTALSQDYSHILPNKRTVQNLQRPNPKI
jgi:hypothetical protein